MRKPPMVWKGIVMDEPPDDDAPSGHTPGSLLCLACAWSSISKDQLVAAGVITGNEGGSDWKRFNDDPMTFIMKLPPERLPALCKLLN